MRKILDLTEMPPVYIPKRRSNLKYAFQEMTQTLQTMRYSSASFGRWYSSRDRSNWAIIVLKFGQVTNTSLQGFLTCILVPLCKIFELDITFIYEIRFFAFLKWLDKC